MTPIRSARLFWWWLISFAKKQQRLILGTCVVVILAAILIRQTLPLLPQLKSWQRSGIVGQYTLTTLPYSFTQRLGRGLFKLTESGEVEPDLAFDWQVNEDETEYLVRLKPGQLWNDGTPLKSSEINYELPGVVTATPDDMSLTFKLGQPYSPFLQLLATPVFKNKIIGTGEQSIKDINWQGQYLKRLQLQGGEFDSDYRFYPSHQSAWLGFRLGEVDRLENLIINPLDDRWTKRVNLETSTNYQTFIGILFNLEDSQVSSKSLRQALAYAIEEKSPPGTERAFSPLSPKSWAYSNQVKPYDFNAQQAKDLFEKFKEESENQEQLNLTLGTSSSFLSFAESIARSWESVLGIKVTVKTVNSIEPDWQIILAAQEVPEDPDQHQLWHSTQSTNLTHYSDLKVDKLLEDGRQISDKAKREEIYRDFQRFIVEDTPVIFLYYPTTYTIWRK